MVDAYAHYCEVLFQRFRGKVKYWLTFNEINMLLHMPFMGAGLLFAPGENVQQVKYQPLTTSWWPAQRPSSWPMPSCPMRGGLYVGRRSSSTPAPAPLPMCSCCEADRDNYFFIDVQSRGEYPVWAKKRMERAGIALQMEPGDEQLLKEGTVDFISFSYYSSRCTLWTPN